MSDKFNPFCYKKPTPTDINTVKGLDFLSRALFREILAMCRDEEGTVVFRHGNKQFKVTLKSGQMILRISDIAESLGISKERVVNRLKILNKIYTEINIEGKPFGTIVTLKDYDSLIKMISKPVISQKTNTEDNSVCKGNSVYFKAKPKPTPKNTTKEEKTNNEELITENQFSSKVAGNIEVCLEDKIAKPTTKEEKTNTETNTEPSTSNKIVKTDINNIIEKNPEKKKLRFYTLEEFNNYIPSRGGNS